MEGIQISIGGGRGFEKQNQKLTSREDVYLAHRSSEKFLTNIYSKDNVAIRLNVLYGLIQKT